MTTLFWGLVWIKYKISPPTKSERRFYEIGLPSDSPKVILLGLLLLPPRNCFITRFCNALVAEDEGAYKAYVTDSDVTRKAAKTVRNNFN